MRHVIVLPALGHGHRLCLQLGKVIIFFPGLQPQCLRIGNERLECVWAARDQTSHNNSTDVDSTSIEMGYYTRYSTQLKFLFPSQKHLAIRISIEKVQIQSSNWTNFQTSGTGK